MPVAVESLRQSVVCSLNCRMLTVMTHDNERYRDVQASVEKEMVSMQMRDIGWEDLFNVSILCSLQ